MAAHGLAIEMEQMVDERNRFYTELRSEHPDVFVDAVGLPLIHPDPVKAFPHLLCSLIKMRHDKYYEPSNIAGVKKRRDPCDPLYPFSIVEQLAAAKSVIERLVDELSKYRSWDYE